jgi:hypothetical protein
MEKFADADKRADRAEHRIIRVFPPWDPSNAARSVELFIRKPITFDRRTSCSTLRVG